MHGLMFYRRFGRARSLRSDRAEWAFGRYVVILLEFLSDDSSLFHKWIEERAGKLQYGQIGHPAMVPAKAHFRTYAIRSSTLHGQYVRYGEKQ
ncbi:hypothetical protein DY000_02060303 [Brassica cretica]|uniref:Uncharacterized protein n=1 Tax=Brassica cretica TaxID=69181 RepID=A0ABQ7AQ70_BRACR|nr:hypothetical protein DY000_02060303 [Brassica cretica]